MTGSALLFPGQGSQYIGMGKELYDTFAEAREVFQEVDDTLKQKLSSLMFEGSEPELTATMNAQPAIMTVSQAILKVLEKQFDFNISTYNVSAGHSLGEYSALCAARTFSISTTAKLLRIRGQAMQKAVPLGEGGMLALLGADIEKVNSLIKQVADKGVFCQIANDNGSGQYVISGETKAIDLALKLAKDLSIRKAVKLPVSAPFHSSLMQSAAIKMAAALSDVEISAPIIPIIANVTADFITDTNIRDLLVEQVTSTVKWQETMEKIYSLNIDTIIEIGPGNILTNLAKRMKKGIVCFNLEKPQGLEQFAQAI